MAVEDNLSRELGALASIDFVEQFGQRFNSLFDLLGIERIVPMANGSLIKTYKSSVTLNGDNVEAGDVIPLSEVKLEEGTTQELSWDKRRKAVAMEDVQKFGFEQAIAISDTKFINEIQKGVRTKLLDQLASGTGETEGNGLQQTLANAWGEVNIVFDEDDADVISFINPLDAAAYLGNANISTQTAFGMNYIEDFLNNRIVFMHGSVPRGTTYTTAAQNLVAAHAVMNGGAIGQAFDFTTDETGLIGVTHDINKTRLTAETITAYGIVLFAEIIDGVIVGTIAEESTSEEP